MSNKISLLFVVIIVFTIINLATVNKKINTGKVPLEIQTYHDGKNQLTHPTVISFDKEWNGYKYWMAYTPYPNAYGGEENPSIAVSNDMYKWETPKGLANPIADNEELGCDELKDSHILYRDDLDRIEVWYLGRISSQISNNKYDEKQLTMFRKYSYDGIHWSDYEVLHEVDYLSPSIIYKDGKYQIWHIGFGTYKTTGTFVYQESEDGYNWSKPKQCSIDNKKNNLELWHGSVNYNEEIKKYEFVYIDGVNNDGIYYCSSDDGINFTKNERIVELDTKVWDHFYRPTLDYIDNNYYCIYGVVTDNNEWYLSMSQGKDLYQLKGLDLNDKDKMIGINYSNLEKTTLSKIRNIFSTIKASIRYECFLLILLLVPLCYFKFKNINDFKNIIYLLSISLSICGLYSFYLYKTLSFSVFIIPTIFVSFCIALITYALSNLIIGVYDN